MIGPGTKFNQPDPGILAGVEHLQQHESWPRIAASRMALVIEEHSDFRNRIIQRNVLEKSSALLIYNWAGDTLELSPGWKFWLWPVWIKLAVTALSSIRATIEDNV